MSVIPFYFRHMLIRCAAIEACILKQDSSDVFNTVVFFSFSSFLYMHTATTSL